MANKSIVFAREFGYDDYVAEGSSTRIQIVVRIPNCDSAAQFYGWENVKVMKDDLSRALQILPLDMQTRIAFL